MPVIFKDAFLESIRRSSELLQSHEYSASYRKGVSGEWRKEFTPELIELFRQTDTENWIERLNYGWS